MPDKEDLRAAATIATSLSGYVMAGALALIGAESAIFVFLLDKKEISLLLWVLLAICFLCFFVSCWIGGKGIGRIYSDGAKGNWHTRVGGRFRLQFALCLAGILLLMWISWLANHAPERAG